MEVNKKKHRNWCFTINNYDKMDPHILSDMKRELSAARYWVFGREVAPDTGTKHLQGCVAFENPQWFNRVKRMLPHGAHIEWCRGSCEQNITYCKKDGDWEEYGDPPMTQKRKGEMGAETQQAKWRKIGDMAKEGKMEELLEEFPRETIVSYRTLKLIRNDMLSRKAKPLSGPLENIYYWGESGCGKTARADREWPDAFSMTIPKQGVQAWWDGYDGQETVIINDVSVFNKSFTDELKTWTEHRVITGQVKGSMIRLRPKRFVITSQYTIDEIWDDEKTRAALHRRFKEIEVREEEEAKLWPWDERYEVPEHEMSDTERESCTQLDRDWCEEEI